MSVLAVQAAFDAQRVYAKHVNPQWVRLLHVLGMDAEYESCEASELITHEGRRILDFLSGYCVYNTGHNHPRIIQALHEELDRRGPTMLQSHVPALAAELAQRLCRLVGGGLEKVFFASSGSEGVEAAIKFARAHTGKPGLVYARGAFHGLTCGALSLMSDEQWRGGFGPLLPDTHAVPFGDLDALARVLATGRIAAFFVEPLQGEAGIRVPPADYLKSAQQLCHRHGALLVMDEVQTGMFRTGPFLAAHHFDVKPDIVVLAKALSGGMVPCGAVLMADRVYRSVYRSLSKAIVHASTFSENALSMRAGLASLDVLEDESLGQRAAEAGRRLRQQLTDRLRPFEMFDEVRGQGLFNGLVFREPTSLGRRVFYRSFTRVHEGMFGQILVSQLYGDHGVLTQMCGNDYMVLKAAPPLVVRDEQIDVFVDAVTQVVETIHDGHSFWRRGLALVPRAVGI